MNMIERVGSKIIRAGARDNNFGFATRLASMGMAGMGIGAAGGFLKGADNAEEMKMEGRISSGLLGALEGSLTGAKYGAAAAMVPRASIGAFKGFEPGYKAGKTFWAKDNKMESAFNYVAQKWTPDGIRQGVADSMARTDAVASALENRFRMIGSGQKGAATRQTMNDIGRGVEALGGLVGKGAGFGAATVMASTKAPGAIYKWANDKKPTVGAGPFPWKDNPSKHISSTRQHPANIESYATDPSNIDLIRKEKNKKIFTFEPMTEPYNHQSNGMIDAADASDEQISEHLRFEYKNKRVSMEIVPWAVGGFIGAGLIGGAISASGGEGSSEGHPSKLFSNFMGGRQLGDQMYAQSEAAMSHGVLMRNPYAAGMRDTDDAYSYSSAMRPTVPPAVHRRGRGLVPGQYNDTGDLVFALHNMR